MSNYKQLKTLLAQLLPTSVDYQPSVKNTDQSQKTTALNENINNESFYFIFNCTTCTFNVVKGVSKWLGYPENQFSVDDYLKAVHPAQTVQFNIIAHAMYKLLCAGKFRLHFDTQRYISLIALKHYNGHYIVFKKTTSVFQYDTQNRLLEQLNEFTMIGPYDGRPLSPRIFELAEFQREVFESILYKMVLETFMQKKYFSEKEFAILQQYAENPKLTSAQVAHLVNLPLATVFTYNKRILDSAREVFTCPFDTAKDVALYLKKEKILA